MTKPIKLFLLLTLLVLTSMITAKTLSAVLSFKRGVIHLWNDMSQLSSSLDNAAYYGADALQTGIIPTYISGVKGGKHDYIGDGITYAHTKGIKIFLLMDMSNYADADWEAFKNNTSIQGQFLSDMDWILQRYPTLDGIELEEPHAHIIQTDGGASWRIFTNDFFTKCKNIISKYRPTDQPETFLWSFNCASNSKEGVWANGIDTAYINTNKLFNAYGIQNAATTLNDYMYNITIWQSRFPNLEIFSGTLLTWSGLIDGCASQYPSWDSPKCWSPAFFDQLKWANSVDHSVQIFTLPRLAESASMWPNDTTPGTTAGDKVIYIWGGVQQAYPAGIPWVISSDTITPTTIQVEDFDMMTAGLGQGEAYKDTESANQGGVYRTADGVDIETFPGGYDIGWTKPGEWLEYSINVQQSGEYNISLKVAGGAGVHGPVHLEFGPHHGTPYVVTNSTAIYNTGGWYSWTTFTFTGVSLTSGIQVMKLVMDNGTASDCGNFDNISIVKILDALPPSSVGNLTTGNLTGGTIVLNWTSVGDNGNSGTASVYDIRYSNVSINENNWGSATQCNDEPTPLVSGTTQSYTVQGLSPNTNYYFAMKVGDEVPNWSGILNSPTGKTNANTAPVLIWTGELGYTGDGLNPDTGIITTSYVYRVKYFDIDDNAPKAGYPKIHIKKGGVEIAGSPFVMTTTDTSSYSSGRIYSYTKQLAETDKDYSYYFEAKDINDGIATGLPTATIDAPDVNVITYGIKGNVQVYKSSSGISGVTMNLSGKSNSDLTTGEEGSYEFVGLESGNYIIKPVSSNWRFWPNEMSYTNLSNDMVEQNYVCKPLSVTKIVSPQIQISSGMAVTPISENSSVDSEISVTVPIGAFSTTANLTLKAIEVPVSDRRTMKVVGYGIEMVNDKNLQPKEMLITISYDDSSIAGYNESKLVVGWYDENNKRWEALPSTVYSSYNKVIAKSNHLSKFALLESIPITDFSNIKIYPNPYNPDTAVSGKLKIINLPMNSIAKLYSVTGEIVRELKEIDFGNLGWLEWDGKNDDGDKVGKAVYIYQIEDGTGKKKTGKIGLIK
ncbi:MAG: carbohydrate-binding protein [Elusimicrobia bacterium]|nr:carbohydrate-binding protein [Elusimicrobiota bacterium]